MKFILLTFTFAFAFFNFSIEKSSFYDVLSSDSIEKIDNMIQRIEKEKPTSINLAYKGTLVAKKASFVKNVGEKVRLFKSGITLLEAEINKSPKEIEYRFLRLSIQENCPKILKYNQNIEEDVTVITKEYASLNKGFQKIIMDYAKNSKALNSSKLK